MIHFIFYSMRRPPFARLVLFALICVSLVLVGCTTPRKSACEGKLQFDGQSGFQFTENEDLLLCGDSDSDADGWKNIPFSQREFMVRSYLKTRGYHHTSVRFENDRLIVDPGVKSRIRNVEFNGAPPQFFDVGYVGWRGALLQSASLDDIESWTNRRLHEVGYPCAKVTLLANTDTEQVQVTIDPGKPEVFPVPTYDESRPFSETVMRRYDAFQIDDWYDERLTNLTSSRMAQDGVVFKSYFAPDCVSDPFALRHRVAVGEPRLLRLGVGASTEELIFFKGSWRNTRLGSGASKFYVDAYASKLRQSLQVGTDWYFSNKIPRWYLQPIALAERIDERYQEYFSTSVSPLLANRIDFSAGTLESKFGPGISYEQTFDGVVAGGKTYYRLETEFRFSDYPFQVYAGDPRQGYTLFFATTTIAKNRYTTAGIHRFRIEGTALLNLGHYDPPQVILGTRFGIRSVVVPPDTSLRDNLPSDFYSFLGGEQNVRGFGRQELPLGRKGALSSAYLGFEARFPTFLPKGFDPLLFTDYAWMGDGNFGFDSTIFFSPGFGIRYLSPIGAVRTTVAHGWVLGPNPQGSEDAEHWQFFLSLGREF